MAQLSDVQSALQAQTQAVEALPGRIVPPAATAADLDGLLSTINSNTAAINAIDPSAPAPAA